MTKLKPEMEKKIFNEIEKCLEIIPTFNISVTEKLKMKNDIFCFVNEELNFDIEPANAYFFGRQFQKCHMEILIPILLLTS